MPTRFSVVLDDDRSQEIEALARQYDLTEEAVLRQVLDIGLDTLEIERAADGGVPGDSDP